MTVGIRRSMGRFLNVGYSAAKWVPISNVACSKKLPLSLDERVNAIVPTPLVSAPWRFVSLLST